MYTNPSSQTGNVALMTAVLTMLFSFVSVLSLDVGRVYFERENLKKLSETVALDIVANSDIFNGESVGDVSSMALASVVRNGFDPDADGFTVSARRIAMETDESGAWQIPEDSNAVADHVLVEISKEIPSSLFFDLQQVLSSEEEVSETLTVSVSSIARRSLFAAFSTESRLLAVDTDESGLLAPILEGMLGVGVDLEAISSSGLLSQNVQIKDLANAFVSLGEADEIDSVSSLLALEVTAAGLFEAIQEAASDSLMVDQNNALSSMISNASTDLANKTFALGNILLLETTEVPFTYIGAIPLRLDSLLESAVMTANTSVLHTIENIPFMDGIAEVDADIEIITPPAIAIGPPGCAYNTSPCEKWRTKGRSSQIQLNLRTSINLLNIANANAHMEINGVQGEAWLVDVTRPNEGQFNQANLEVRSQLLDYTVPMLEVELLPLEDVQGPLNLTESLCEEIKGVNLLDALLGWVFEDDCSPPSLLNLSLTADNNIEDSFDRNSQSAQLSWPDSPTTIVYPNTSDVLSSSLANSLNQIHISLSSDSPGIDLLVSQIDLANDGVLGGTGLTELQEGLNSALRSALINDLVDSLLTPVLDALGISFTSIELQLHGMSASPAEVVI